MPPQRGLDNAFDLQNMSMASMAPQPLEQQIKAQQHAYPTHFSTFLQEERSGAGPGGLGAQVPKPQGSFDHRDNLVPKRDKFFTEDFAQRERMDRMSTMNMGQAPPQNEDVMSNGLGAPPGIPWLSSQNKQATEYQ